jgi:hypothetical protein
MSLSKGVYIKDDCGKLKIKDSSYKMLKAKHISCGE